MFALSFLRYKNYVGEELTLQRRGRQATREEEGNPPFSSRQLAVFPQ